MTGLTPKHKPASRVQRTVSLEGVGPHAAGGGALIHSVEEGCKEARLNKAVWTSEHTHGARSGESLFGGHGRVISRCLYLKRVSLRDGTG